MTTAERTITFFILFAFILYIFQSKCQPSLNTKCCYAARVCVYQMVKYCDKQAELPQKEKPHPLTEAAFLYHSANKP
ncbi:hypothetical protein FLA_0526 [Filimonas lacunae]|nr:hypothetical protein FLA_0526 [Filimonas lacunae]